MKYHFNTGKINYEKPNKKQKRDINVEPACNFVSINSCYEDNRDIEPSLQ